MQEELRAKFGYNGEHTLTENGDIYQGKKKIATGASTNRRVADISLFESTNPKRWERVYSEVVEWKYQKTRRNFSRLVTGKKHTVNKRPPIYLIPRQRGGPSYKEIDLIGADVADIMFMPISKGFSMQGVSSFTIGPVVGEGLCLVNAAFSKSICIFHLTGGGEVDLKRKNFWRNGKSQREIEYIDDDHITVDGELFDTQGWLEENEDLWFEEWNKWRKHVALCSRGDFHWDNGETVAYRKGDKYLSFVKWKKECYIRPSYDLLPKTIEFQFLLEAWKDNKRAIGLVHPMARSNNAAKPITRKYLRKMFDSEYKMTCQPYVVAGKLLGVPIN